MNSNSTTMSSSRGFNGVSSFNIPEPESDNHNSNNHENISPTTTEFDELRKAFVALKEDYEKEKRKSSNLEQKVDRLVRDKIEYEVLKQDYELALSSSTACKHHRQQDIKVQASKKKQKLIQDHHYHQSGFDSSFDAVCDDSLEHIVEYVGKNSYHTVGLINKRCHKIYVQKYANNNHGGSSSSSSSGSGSEKRTFIFGYAPLSMILELPRKYNVWRSVLHFNRRDVLHWLLIRQNKDLLHTLCSKACQEGRIDILREVFANSEEQTLRHLKGCECTLTHFATDGQQIKTLKYLVANGCVLTESCCGSAGHYGRLDILKILREEYNCPWDENTCIYAAEKGRLNILMYAKKHGCPFHEDACMFAARYNHFLVLQWLRSNGCPCPDYLE